MTVFAQRVHLYDICVVFAWPRAVSKKRKKCIPHYPLPAVPETNPTTRTAQLNLLATRENHEMRGLPMGWDEMNEMQEGWLRDEPLSCVKFG